MKITIPAIPEAEVTNSLIDHIANKMKTIVVILTPIIAYIVGVVADVHMSTSAKVVTLVGYLVTVLGAYQAKNKPLPTQVAAQMNTLATVVNSVAEATKNGVLSDIAALAPVAPTAAPVTNSSPEGQQTLMPPNTPGFG